MSSITITKQNGGWKLAAAELAGRIGGWFKPRFGIRARQIALITMFVSVVVMITTVADIAHLSNVVVRQTKGQAEQLSHQVIYAVQQEIAHNNNVDHFINPYFAIASDHSGVRALMESAIAVKGPIGYLYLTNGQDEIVTDQSGQNQLAANQHMIDKRASNLATLADASAYRQLISLLFGPSTYEYSESINPAENVPGTLHIGISSNFIRAELRSPIETNLLIGLLAVIGAAIVSIASANLMLKPLEVISTSIDRLNLGEGEPLATETPLPHDQVVSGVTARLRQLGERMAGDRSELEIMRGRLRQVISHLEERLLLINREGRIILASPDAEDLLDTGGHELTGLPIDECLGASHPLVQLVERSFTERRSIPRTSMDVPYGANSKRLLASLQYIEDAGEPVGSLVSLRDFESFQKLETQWDLSKKLADLGRITSGIAHEVKNPLNAMVIHLEILRSKLENGVGDPTPQLDILHSEIKRLDRVVQTFLNFTRPVEMRLDPLDLNSLVDQVVTLAHTEAKERGVTITASLSSSSPTVKGDADTLKQALLNVIINGCQAMPNGGPLGVQTFSEGDWVHITVSDRGVGISPEARDRIFNLYYTTKKGGTGIGLAQAFRAIQLHNGQINFASEIGRGTTFDILLPAAE